MTRSLKANGGANSGLLDLYWKHIVREQWPPNETPHRRKRSGLVENSAHIYRLICAREKLLNAGRWEEKKQLFERKDKKKHGIKHGANVCWLFWILENEKLRKFRGASESSRWVLKTLHYYKRICLRLLKGEII